MAKLRRGIFKVSGTMDDYTFVYGRNGRYMRKKRGSNQPIVVNEVLQSFADRHNLATKTAKGVNDALKAYAGYFKEGAFWANLLSRLKKCPDDELTTQLNCLAGLELNSQHRLSFFTRPTFNVESIKKGITVQLSFDRHPKYRRNEATCYYYELIILLWGEGRVVISHSSVETNWVSYNDTAPEYAFYFDRPGGATHYLLAVKLESGINDIATDAMWGKAMGIVGGGKL